MLDKWQAGKLSFNGRWVMKKILSKSVVAVFLLGLASTPSGATPTTITPNVENLLLNAKASNRDKINDSKFINIAFDFSDLIDDYNFFYDAFFTVSFEDDNDRYAETAMLTYDGMKTAGSVTQSSGKKKGRAISSSLASYGVNSSYWTNHFSVNPEELSDGFFSVKISAVNGDFWFRNAVLTFDIKGKALSDPPGPDILQGGNDCGVFTLSGPGATSQLPVPEPGSMLLFGTGMLGLASIIRRRLS